MFNPIAVNIAGAAGFATNFSTSSYTGHSFFNATGRCDFGENGCAVGFFNNADPSPFYQEVKGINGTYYWHVLVGDPASGFAQESYTRYGRNSGSAADGVNFQGAFSPDSGGMENLSSSCQVAGSNCIEGNGNIIANLGNTGKPLAGPHVSGNGTSNPSYTVFHLVLISADGDMSLEVEKPFLDTKPRISQTVQDGNMSSTFIADMRGIGYQDMNNPIGIVNNTVIDDPTIPGATGAANFTMANAQQSTVTAGRFTFTPGTGWNNSNGWDAPNASFGLGTYSYYGAATGYDVYAVDWTSYFEYDQNVLNCTRRGANDSSATNTSENTRIAMGQGGDFSCPGHP